VLEINEDLKEDEEKISESTIAAAKRDKIKRKKVIYKSMILIFI
jgi:hypothetical protein